MAMDNNELAIGDVSEIVNQMLEDDKVRMNRYALIDDAVNCVFIPDTNIANLPFIQGRSFALTDISDARNAGTRVFTTQSPNISIAPVIDNEGEYERVDKMEQAWKWEMEKMNRPVNGRKGVHDLIVESAVTYHAVALQTEYLPYKFKGRESDARIKALLARKCFQWTVHHPGTVHAKYSDYGVEHVAKVATYSAQQLIENYPGSAGAQKIRAEHTNAKTSELMRIEYTLVDYMDWKRRVIFAVPRSGGNIALSPHQAVFMNEEHGLPFLPWVIVDYGQPLWQSVLESGHWNNVQHMKLIKFARAVALGMMSDFAIKTADGTLKGVWIDYNNPTNPIVLPAGAEIVPLAGRRLDQQFEAEYQEDRADISRSTVARILQDSTPFIKAPFSSFNAAITTALGQLSPAKRTAETTEAEAIGQGFAWIKHSSIPFNSYRAKTSDSKQEGGAPYMRGGQIVITPEEPPAPEEIEKMSEKERAYLEKNVYFSLDSLYITVELRSANMTDEQARQNLLINAIDRFGMSQQEGWERMGWEGYELNRMQRANEMLFDAELQKNVQLKLLEPEQAKMQMQVQAQQQSLQNQQNQQNAGSAFASMQGADLRGGGMAAAASAPNENRVSIRGRTDNGGQTV